MNYANLLDQSFQLNVVAASVAFLANERAILLAWGRYWDDVVTFSM